MVSAQANPLPPLSSDRFAIFSDTKFWQAADEFGQPTETLGQVDPRTMKVGHDRDSQTKPNRKVSTGRLRKKTPQAVLSNLLLLNNGFRTHIFSGQQAAGKFSQAALNLSLH